MVIRSAASLVRLCIALVAQAGVAGVAGVVGVAFAQTPSAGCVAPRPEAPPLSIEVAGATRELIARVPVAADSERPAPLLMAFHGRTNSNTQVRSYYRLEKHVPADTILLYPAGRQGREGRFSWSNPNDPAGALRDYALFDALLDTYGCLYCIDLERVFVVGHSLGATFANSLGCARADRIRALGSVAGGIQSSSCAGPVAAIVFHHPNDNLVPFSEGLRVRDALLEQNAFTGEGRAVDVGADGGLADELACRAWGEPASSRPLVFCEHRHATNGRGRQYPHNWPPQAAPAIAEFFESLPAR
jgi:polyhydroxybutyrate depolymerase